MRELLDKIESWRQQGQQVALATVVKVYGSAPRPLGAKMAISSLGEMAGSVSGGCVEGAVFEEAQACLKRRRPKLIAYGISDETAWSVGLACGGQIEVFVEPLIGDVSPAVLPAQQTYEILLHQIRKENYCAQATILEGNDAGQKLILFKDGEARGSLGSAELDQNVAFQSKNIWKNQQPHRFNLETARGKLDIFVDVFPPRDKLIIVGGVHIAIPLVHFAKTLGFHTLVLDARSVFGSQERFPETDELMIAWPADALEKMDIDESTYIVVVSHDEKLDNPALKVALSSKARYIGALGSTRTHAKRVAALIDMGVAEGLIKRIHAPIGVNLGAVGAEEIALSIMAEIIQARRNVSA
jgi:xanthine dehydrogenase accessory factor